MKNAGILGVIHKASQGTSYVDPMYATRRQQALDAGLLFGAYHFGEYGSGYNQADHFLETVRPTPTDLLVLDWEACDPDPMTLANAEFFAEALWEATDRWCGLYSGMSFCTDAMVDCGLTPLSNCWLWLARYSTEPPVVPPPWPVWTFWQYCDNGTVPGVEGGCDRDRFNGTMDGLMRLWGIENALPPVLIV
jgi:lysozyme